MPEESLQKYVNCSVCFENQNTQRSIPLSAYAFKYPLLVAASAVAFVDAFAVDAVASAAAVAAAVAVVASAAVTD